MAENLERLREPFPPNTVGKLPKGGMMLDFVGHAAVTDRLLSVDPEWSWEPFAVDSYGLPALDADGNLWIRLTVCGVTRIGVGDGKNAKERIGDALRNAAMRFGVALALWSKDELESGIPAELPDPLEEAKRRAWHASANRATSDDARRTLWSDALAGNPNPTVADFDRLAEEWSA